MVYQEYGVCIALYSFQGIFLSILSHIVTGFMYTWMNNKIPEDASNQIEKANLNIIDLLLHYGTSK